ncbi:MAG TPA: ABC transporter ATP-binding protein [Bryobacterales bacterium]|jgi:cobalt/nickel transport system ATP-binding protein|nr:ABC transporter ATP-binding protein [Bryobacterales bacterium]
MEPLIRVENLSHRYDDGTQALRGVDFVLYPGETVAVFGPNGSGKTTFLLCLSGLLESEGRIEICGLPAERKNFPAIRQKAGILFQDSDDQLFMPTVYDDVAFGPLNLGLEAAEVDRRVRECLRLVDMEAAAGKAPYHLSAGEKRRAALAGVLAMQPEILFLDEPVTFLDPPGRAALVDILGRLPQAKLIISHDVDLARELATRAIFFQNGQIAASGPVEEIIERFRWDTTPRFTH